MNARKEKRWKNKKQKDSRRESEERKTRKKDIRRESTEQNVVPFTESIILSTKFGIIPERQTPKAIHILIRLVERFREKKRDLHVVIIELERL